MEKRDARTLKMEAQQELRHQEPTAQPPPSKIPIKLPI
jgi:hypothetical protein